jgi:DNA-binding transcriptional LysR family regulator
LKLLLLATEPIMLAVPAGHPLAGRTGVELASLREETLVDLPAGWGSGWRSTARSRPPA